MVHSSGPTGKPDFGAHNCPVRALKDCIVLHKFHIAPSYTIYRKVALYNLRIVQQFMNYMIIDTNEFLKFS